MIENDFQIGLIAFFLVFMTVFWAVALTHYFDEIKFEKKDIGYGGGHGSDHGNGYGDGHVDPHGGGHGNGHEGGHGNGHGKGHEASEGADHGPSVKDAHDNHGKETEAAEGHEKDHGKKKHLKKATEEIADGHENKEVKTKHMKRSTIQPFSLYGKKKNGEESSKES